MMHHQDLIVAALLAPRSTLTYSSPQWDLLIRQGRRTKLLARLAYLLEDAGLMSQVPAAARLHLESAIKLAVRQEVSLRWEVTCLQKELANAGSRITLLKGAAYAMAGLPAARGRSFSDIDIIVPKERMVEVESELMLYGWQGGHHDEYDQRYYRQWMHEIPPLAHVTRGTTIDVHHAILPETARVKVNTVALLKSVVPLAGNADGQADLFVLSPTDMLLHSATHLFHEGDFDKGLRDLFDLDSLFRDFGKQPGFWPALAPRALEVGLTRPLYYAVRFTTRLLETPIPAEVVSASAIGRPSALAASLMDICYSRALRPLHPSTASFGNWLARFVLYVRSHWIRMPLHLLAYHLGRKAFIRPKPPESDNELSSKPEVKV
jgi:Uncharacterised nucleotidyltransferase